MQLIWCVIQTIISFIDWIGQTISAINPDLALQLGMTEAESEIYPVFFVDVRGEAVWDAISLWVLPAAGIMLLLNNPVWTPLGLIGSYIYIYFAGKTGLCVEKCNKIDSELGLGKHCQLITSPCQFGDLQRALLAFMRWLSFDRSNKINNEIEAILWLNRISIHQSSKKA